jgi:MurNAc alpha-1-phosphate uridylyltransferase
MHKRGQAMILAAGEGRRMGRLSEIRPKPLTRVNGITLIDRIIQKLLDKDISPIVVNVHHLAGQIEQHVDTHIKAGNIYISDERGALLETGGGVKRAISSLENEFFVINSDILWDEIEGVENTLDQLTKAWDPIKMDVLLLLIPIAKAYGYDGVGDFFYDGDAGEANTIRFRGDAAASPYMYGGLQIVKAEMYNDMPEGAWSNREIFRKASTTGRLYGVPHEGVWMHVGTEDGIKAAEDHLTSLGIQ